MRTAPARKGTFPTNLTTMLRSLLVSSSGEAGSGFTQEMLQLSGQPDSGVQLAKLQKVNPLITVMGVKRRNHYGDVLGPTIISDALSG